MPCQFGAVGSNETSADLVFEVNLDLTGGTMHFLLLCTGQGWQFSSGTLYCGVLFQLRVALSIVSPEVLLPEGDQWL